MKNEQNDLLKDETLSLLYQEIPAEEPSSAVDAFILAAAQKEAARSPETRQRVTIAWWKRLRLPVAIMTTIVITVTLFPALQKEPLQRDKAMPLPPRQAIPLTDEKPAALPAPAVRSAREMGQTELEEKKREVSEKMRLESWQTKAASAKNDPATAHQKSDLAPAQREKQMASPPAPTSSAPTITNKSVRAQAQPAAPILNASPPSARALPQDAHSSGAAIPSLPEAFPESYRARSTTTAPAAPQEVLAEASAPAEQVTIEKAQVNKAAEQSMDRPAAGSVEKQTAPSAVPPLAAKASNKSYDHKDMPAQTPGAQDWLAKINQLRYDNKTEEARRELEAFMRAFPDYPIPEELKKLLVK